MHLVRLKDDSTYFSYPLMLFFSPSNRACGLPDFFNHDEIMTGRGQMARLVVEFNYCRQ